MRRDHSLTILRNANGAQTVRLVSLDRVAVARLTTALPAYIVNHFLSLGPK